MPLPAYFHDKFIWWDHLCIRQLWSILIASILNQHANDAFVACLTLHLAQAVENFWRYWEFFLLASWKAERSFFFINRIHSRPRNSISTDLLGTFAVISRHGHTILILKQIYPVPIWASTLIEWWHHDFLLTLYLLDICTFCRLLRL